jgi:peptide/nickel transport system ATP-binding protein
VFREPGAAREIDISKPSARDFGWLRGNRITLAFQEPSAALSPVVSVGAMLMEHLQTHQQHSSSAAKRRVIEVLARVGFPDPEAAFGRYPFELSGGLRQRAMLASALVCKPALVIADEPTSALDVTVQALALKLLADLQDEMGLSLLFITHDFGVVANVADYVIVLRDGLVVEQGSVHEVLRRRSRIMRGRCLRPCRGLRVRRSFSIRRMRVAVRFKRWGRFGASASGRLRVSR